MVDCHVLIRALLDHICDMTAVRTEDLVPTDYDVVESLSLHAVEHNKLTLLAFAIHF